MTTDDALAEALAMLAVKLDERKSPREWNDLQEAFRLLVAGQRRSRSLEPARRTRGSRTGPTEWRCGKWPRLRAVERG